MKRVAAPVVFGVLLLAVWEGAIAVFDIEKFLLPRPSEVWSAFLDNREAIVDGLRITGGNAIYGLVVGTALGVGVALATSRFRLVNDALSPLAAGANAMPIVALATIFNNWFSGSTNEFPRRLVVILVVFFPVFVNLSKGLTQVDNTHVQLMRSYAASDWAIVRRVRIPNAVPYLMGALTIVSPLALISAIVAEYFGGTQGSLGQVITQSAGLTQYDRAWAAVLAASAMGLLLFVAALTLERVTTPNRKGTSS